MEINSTKPINTNFLINLKKEKEKLENLNKHQNDLNHNHFYIIKKKFLLLTIITTFFILYLLIISDIVKVLEETYSKKHYKLNWRQKRKKSYYHG